MLSGNIIYKQGDKKYKFDVTGIDSSSSLKLRLESGNWDALRLTNAVDDDDVVYARQVKIDLAKVVVQRKVSLDASGKKVKAGVNTDFFCSLASTVRYMKAHCTKHNQVNHLDIALASGDFEPEATSTYSIPHEVDNGVFGEVELDLGDIKRMQISTPIWDIDIADDKGLELSLFPEIKDGFSSGIAFNKDYLGFDLKPQIIAKVTNNGGMYTCIEDIVAAHPDKEFSWLLKKDYHIVSDDTLEEVCNYIMNWDGYVYYDTETTGLNITFKSRLGADQGDQLVGVVLSVKYGESFYFPLQMKAIPNLCGGDHWYVMEHYLRPILEGKQLVAHNMSFDWKVAYIYNINANIVHDTMALIRLTLGAERKDYPMGLKANTKLLLSRDSLELSDLVLDNAWGKGNDIKFWDLPYELVRLYACADTDNTNGIFQYAMQKDLLTQYGAKKVYEIEIAFSFAVGYQEFYGHKINLNNIGSLREEIQQGLDTEMKAMEELCGHSFNPNSPKDLINILYTEMGIPEQISRKTGRVTTERDTIKYLAELTDIEDNVKYPFCKHLLKYREYEGVRKIIDKFPVHCTPDGYIFSSVQQYGTNTGRVSITDPNYQSYNDPIKKNVVPRPGYWMSDSDYSSVEYRTLGSMVGNKRIMTSFEDPDFDYHQYQAARMYGVPYSAVTKKMRKAAKGINFGLPYGMGDESLGVRVFGEASAENTKKAAALRNAYFKGQEDIRDWFEYHRNKGVNLGYTETYFGRRRYYHRSDYSVSAIRRQAGNAVIQGSAADIYKTAVGRLFKRISKEGWLGKVLLTGFIHDEVLCEISNDINPMVWLKVLREEFEVKIDGWCPLYMGYGFGMSWYEAKSVELPIKLQWELVAKYGDTGYADWDGDGRKFCDKVPDMLRDFSVRDIRNQILDAKAQGNEIKPSLNNEILDMVKDDADIYTNAINEYLTANHVEDVQAYLKANLTGVCDYLDKNYHIQTLMQDENGSFILEFKPSKSTQDAISQFCSLHGVNRADVNLLDIPDVQASGNVGSDDTVLASYEDEADNSEANKIRIRDTKIDTLGFYLDTDENIIYLIKLPANMLQLLRQKCNTEGKGYRVMFKDNDNHQMLQTSVYLPSEELKSVIDMCIFYLNHK